MDTWDSIPSVHSGMGDCSDLFCSKEEQDKIATEEEKEEEEKLIMIEDKKQDVKLKERAVEEAMAEQ